MNDKLSICFIVKNEENNLKNSLEALQKVIQFVDINVDLLVLDTGSTDATIEIAMKYGARVEYFEWVNDFSKARNMAMSKAKYNLILFLDADEIIEDWDVNESLRLHRLYPDAVGRMKRRNLCNSSGGGKCISNDRVERFFDKRMYHYEGAIHEQLTSNKEDVLTVYDLPLCVYHEGYYGSAEMLKNKAMRNNELLYKDLETNPDDPYIYYQLANSYGIAGEYDKQYECNKEAFLKNPDRSLEYVRMLAVNYLNSMLTLKKYDEAMQFVNREIKNYENYADFWCVAGYVYTLNKEYEKAIVSYNNAIKSKDYNLEDSVSDRPWYNLGCIYEALGDEKKAKVCFKNVKNNSESKQKLVNLECLENEIIYHKKISVVINATSNKIDNDFLNEVVSQSIGIDHIEIFVFTTSDRYDYLEKEHENSVVLVKCDGIVSNEEAIDTAFKYLTGEAVMIFDNNTTIKWDSLRIMFECLTKTNSDVVEDGISYSEQGDFLLRLNNVLVRNEVRKANILRTGYTGKLFKIDIVKKMNFDGNYPEIDYADKIFCIKDNYIFAR